MSLERSESWGDLGLFPGEGQAGTNLGENPCSCVGSRDRERKLWVVCLSREGLGERQGASYHGREQQDFPMSLSSLSCSWDCNTPEKVWIGREGWWNQRLRASATRAGSTDCLKGWQLPWVSPRAQTAPRSFCKDPKWTPTQNLDSSSAEE